MIQLITFQIPSDHEENSCLCDNNHLCMKTNEYLTLKISVMKSHIPFLAHKRVFNWTIKYVVLIFICALIGLCSVYIYISYSQSENALAEPTHSPTQVQKTIFNGKKFVHLDLKGAPPKVTYYEYLFPLFAENGVSGLVIEYEDMFPFRGILANLSALNAYTKKEIEMINELADKNRLEIIPLVQTYGYLEFVLKLQEFKELREDPISPQVLCPSKEKSRNLIFEMLSQVIDAHPNVSKIHIGADETTIQRSCKDCMKIMQLTNISQEKLYLEHVEKIRDFIKDKYPLLKILMWDGELRYLSEDGLEIFDKVDTLGVTPVVSQYEAEVFDNLGPSLWDQYSKMFSGVWIASAFKGATGVDQFIVDIDHYNQNHRSWMDVVQNYKYVLNIDAIILTGRQRQDHFSILCELLPVSLPSLLMNLKILEGEEDNQLDHTKRVAELLHCKHPYTLIAPNFGSPQCSYPGGDILENVHRLHRLKEDYEELKKNSKLKGWMTNTNIYYNFTSPAHIRDIIPQLTNLMEEVTDLEKCMSNALLEVYDVSTEEEWMMTYLSPLKEEIHKLFDAKERVLRRTVWSRRPFKHEIPKYN